MGWNWKASDVVIEELARLLAELSRGLIERHLSPVLDSMNRHQARGYLRGKCRGPITCQYALLAEREPRLQPAVAQQVIARAIDCSVQWFVRRQMTAQLVPVPVLVREERRAA